MILSQLTSPCSAPHSTKRSPGCCTQQRLVEARFDGWGLPVSRCPTKLPRQSMAGPF